MIRLWMGIKLWLLNYFNKNNNTFYIEAGEMIYKGSMIYIDESGKARRK